MGVANAAVQIHDIRNYQNNGSKPCYDVRDVVVNGLKAPFNAKSLPTLLLYNERGLRLFDKITTDAPEYYLFGAEEEIIHNYAPEIVRITQTRALARSKRTPAQVLLDLGAGSLRKTSHILRAFAALVPEIPSIPSVTYFALDLEEQEIRRTLTQLLNSDLGSIIQEKIEAKGILGTWEDGIAFILQGGLQDVVDIRVCVDHGGPSFEHCILQGTRQDSPLESATEPVTQHADKAKQQPQVHMLLLGASIGNFSRGEDAQFLRSLPLRAGYGDTLLLGLDHDNDRDEIEIAYNDPKGLNRSFVMNGLKAAGVVLGDSEVFDLSDWEYANSYDEDSRIHEGFVRCIRPHNIIIPGTKEEVSFLKGELIKFSTSLKYSERDVYVLFTDAGLRPIQRWMDSTSHCSVWLLERPPLVFPLISSPNAPVGGTDGKMFGVLRVQDWQDIWNAWDLVTLRMIPSSMLCEKPIDIRHIYMFNLGHIPTFCDVHLSRLLQEPYAHLEEFKPIPKNGIHTDVEEPTRCHQHSEVLINDEDWPSLGTILSSRKCVRERLTALYANISNGTTQLTRRIARVLFMTYEHEGLYIETLLCMLLQRPGSETVPPPGFTIPPWESMLASWSAAPKLSSPTISMVATTVTLGIDDIETDDAAKASEVEGHVFGWDNESPSHQVSVDTFRISWRPITNGEFFKFYTSMGSGMAAFPASWVELDGGEIAVRTLYGPVSMTIAREWPVLTSYDNLSSYASSQGGRLPTEAELRVFMDKFACGYEGGANVGFRNWHPVPATTGVERHGGEGHNGGVWEWTSTVFDGFDGFVPSQLYPRYSTDFFDGHYRVVLGGSFATIPHIAERRSMRNWYRHDYSYALVGGRVVYDV